MSLIREVVKNIFGADVSEASIMASCFLVFLGAAINFLIELSQRDKASARSPEQFSLAFMLRDNWHRICISFLFCIVAVIVGPALISIIDLNWKIPEDYSRFANILLGWGSDYLPMRIKQRFFKDDSTVSV